MLMDKVDSIQKQMGNLSRELKILGRGMNVGGGGG